jgi:hypothetical protein
MDMKPKRKPRLKSAPAPLETQVAPQPLDLALFFKRFWIARALGWLFVAPWTLLGALLGRSALKSEGGTWRLDMAALRRHLWRNAWFGAYALSLLGLLLAKCRPGGPAFYACLAALLAGLGYYLRVSRPAEKSPFGLEALPRLMAAALPSALALILGAYACGVAWDQAGRVALSRSRARFLEAGHSLGLPQPEAPVADADNAAIPLRRAEAVLDGMTATAGGTVQKDKDEAVLRAFLNDSAARGLDIPLPAGLKPALARYAPAAAAWREAARRPGLAWGLKPGPPWYSAPLPRYSPFLAGARVLAVEAMLDAREGRLASASANVAGIYRLSRLAAKQGFLISTMISIAVEGIGHKAAAQVLRRNGLPPRPPEWDRELRHGSAVEALRRSVMGEMATRTDDFEAMAAGLYAFRGAADLDSILGVQLAGIRVPFLRWDAASDLPIASAELEAMQGAPKSREAFDKAVELPLKGAWNLAEAGQFNVYGMYQKALKADAEMRLAELAFRAREFREKEGRWPDGAWELKRSGEAHVDPFTRGSMRIAPAAGGIRIYSLGPDGVDDQGAPLSDGDPQKGDIAWTLK